MRRTAVSNQATGDQAGAAEPIPSREERAERHAEREKALHAFQAMRPDFVRLAANHSSTATLAGRTLTSFDIAVARIQQSMRRLADLGGQHYFRQDMRLKVDLFEMNMRFQVLKCECTAGEHCHLHRVDGAGP
jgi:hypothetical protein